MQFVAAVAKTLTKVNLRRKGFVLDYALYFSTKKARAESQDKNLEVGPKQR